MPGVFEGNENPELAKITPCMPTQVGMNMGYLRVLLLGFWGSLGALPQPDGCSMPLPSEDGLDHGSAKASWVGLRWGWLAHDSKTL